MKTLLVSGFLLLGVLSSTFSQSEWSFLEEKDGVKISWKYADCDLEMGYDERRVLLRFENTSDQDVLLTYEAELFYDEECLTCDDPNGEYRHEIELRSGTKIAGECSVYSSGAHQFFVRWVSQPNKTELTKFNLANITVQKL